MKTLLLLLFFCLVVVGAMKAWDWALDRFAEWVDSDDL